MNKRSPAFFALALAALAAVLASAAPASHAQEVFYLRATGGASFPFLKNLDDELQLQGNRTVRTGYSFGVSLGRTFYEREWALEVHFATMFFPTFDYTSPYDSFPGRLRHYSYLVVLERHFNAAGKLFKPALGAGIGAGQTNLVTGGGSFVAAEALFRGHVDSSIGETMDLTLEVNYYLGLQSKEFGGPFLENVNTDKVLNSAGSPVKDTYRSLDIRLGLTFWLKPRGTE